LIPKEGTPEEELYIAAAILRLEKWRFHYGRKITPKRIAQFPLPNDKVLRAWISARTHSTRRIQEEILSSYDTDSNLAGFEKLATQWKEGRAPSATVMRMAMHPAYQQIIGMGKKATPLILAELTRDVDHWFWALNAIEGVDPVPAASKGRLKQMVQAWFQWARERGYEW